MIRQPGIRRVKNTRFHWIGFCLLASQIPAQHQLRERSVVFPDSSEGYANSYTYAGGNSVSELTFEVEGSPVQTLRHTYDTENRLTAQQRIAGSDTLPFAEYGYDARDRIVSRTHYTHDGSRAYTDSLRYDAEGLEVQVDRYVDSTRVYYKNKRYPDGVLRQEWEYQLEGDSLPLRQVKVYSYQGGRLTRVEIYKVKQGESTPYRELVYTYTGDRMTGESRYRLNAARRTLEDSTLLQYSSEGYLLRKHHFDSQGTLVRTELFKYEPDISVDPVSAQIKAGLLWNRGILQVRLPETANASLYFFQLDGTLAHHIQLQRSRKLIPHHFLQPGVYFVQLRSGKITTTLKIPLY